MRVPVFLAGFHQHQRDLLILRLLHPRRGGQTDLVYNKGQANWKSKPATMINKVAVSQCVRDAFPKDTQRPGYLLSPPLGSSPSSGGRAFRYSSQASISKRPSQLEVQARHDD